MGNEYIKLDEAPEDDEYYILKHEATISEGISTLDIINEPERFPFKIWIEHTQEVLSREEGYLIIRVAWPSYDEDDTDEEKAQKDLIDTDWGYKVAKYLEDNADNPDVTGAFHMKIRINAIGKPREGIDYDESFATVVFPENYGQYTNYPIDIDGNEKDND